MKSNTLSLVALATVLVPAAILPALAENEGKANPYESIVARNPFNLREPAPPPPDTPPPAPPPPLATVELTGVTSIFSKKKALVEIVPGPGKPPMKLTLDEGERVDAIEIVSIDVDKAEVTINNAGTITNLSLKVAKATGGAPGVPGLPQPGGLIPPIPTPINPTANTFNSSGRNTPIMAGGSSPTPSHGLGAQPINAYGQPGAGGGSPNIYTSGAGGVPNTSLDQLRGAYQRTARTATTVPQQTQAPVDPAVQYINMHVQKQALEAQGIKMPPIPPVQGLDH